MRIFGLAAGPEEANPLAVEQPRSYVLTDKRLGIFAMNGTIYNAHVDTGLTPVGRSCPQSHVLERSALPI
jgi:hypothetical protein